MERRKPKEATEIGPAEFGNEGATEKVGLRQENVSVCWFRNKLVLNLEKEKMIENKKDERERQKKERDMAERKLQAIEQQYRNQMSLLSSKNSASKKFIAHTDHRLVIEGL